MSLPVIQESIFPILSNLVSDQIPNIRFNVAKSYGQLINTLKQLPEQGTVIALEKAGTPGQGCQKATDVITKSILPNLEKLQQDDDVDVRYFATTAAQSFTDAMQT